MIYGWARAAKQLAKSKHSQQMTPEDMPKVVGSETRGTLEHTGCKGKQTQAFKDEKIIEYVKWTHWIYTCVLSSRQKQD